MALPILSPPIHSEGSGVGRLSRSGEIAERRVLVVAPQPFYQDRGTPIALRQVLQAGSELGYRMDLLTFPLGAEVPLPAWWLAGHTKVLSVTGTVMRMAWRTSLAATSS